MLRNIAFDVDGDERSAGTNGDGLGHALGVAVARMVDNGCLGAWLGHIASLVLTRAGLGATLLTAAIVRDKCHQLEHIVPLIRLNRERCLCRTLNRF
jgi:hypothetical protein